jgi:hypothetical protein
VEALEYNSLVRDLVEWLNTQIQENRRGETEDPRHDDVLRAEAGAYAATIKWIHDRLIEQKRKEDPALGLIQRTLRLFGKRP